MTVANIAAPGAPMESARTQLGFADSGTFEMEEQVSQDQLPADGTVQRVILKDASLQITVDDAAITIQDISAMAQEMGGWVVAANSSTNTAINGETYSTGNVTVRVPADRLDQAMAIIRENSIKVSNENVNGRDVTAEYVDMDSRVSNLKVSESALVEILGNARKIEDVLAVQTELTRVRGEIEVLEGRLRFYDEAAAFSSIAVTVQEPIPTIGTTQVDNTWNPLRTAASAFGSLLIIGQNVTDFVIVIIIIGAPFVLVTGGLVWFVRRIWRNTRRETTAPDPA